MSRSDDDSQGTGSDFGDSFLHEVLESFPLPPIPQPGERLGGTDGRRFEILGKLGRGGMGLVVRARDELLQRIVALKFISPGREFTQESLDRVLQDEAQLVAQLDHENIVRIFDVSEWKGSPFLIMECLEGQSLSELLRRGPLELPRTLRILDDITAGLAHAHSRHIIHRDLKPSNVFVLPDGRVKLLDFGLALLVSSLGSTQARSGTPAFMAPEQWRGQPQDMRTDTWAAGLLLYEMLTGELPYSIKEYRALREQVVSSEPVPSVRGRRPDLPEPVERFLARALAKEPARRFQSALEMREWLRELEWSLAPSDELPPPRFISHRRQVSLVCCRLSGSLVSFEPEDLSDLQATFHQASARILERHGAWVALRMGDEVLGCFGCSLAREDDVLCAVRAALVLTRLAEELPQAAETGLTVQVGVHTDMVVLDVFNPSGVQGHTPSIQGDAPRMTIWLAGQAAPHTALLSENTWQGVRGNFVTEPLGQRVFSSSRGAVRLGVHRLVAERLETTRFGRARSRGLTPLVGRSAELRQLLARWERTRQGEGAVLLLSGEAGIGKSRLIQELCEHVEAEGVSCVSSQCWPQLSRSAFHPVLEWVVHLLGLAPEDPPARRWACLEEGLGGLELPHPEALLLLGQLLGLPLREDLPPLLLSPELQRERTLETLASVLLRLPARIPQKGGPGALLLVLEDLHWADPSTLQLLSLLRERIERVGLCVLLSTRPELRLSWGSHPHFHPLMLERLETDETAEMVRRLAGNQADLSARTVEFLVKQTEGNPLYVEELTRMVLSRAPSDGGAPPEEGPLPVTLQELLLARLDPLPQEQKELAWMGAVMGRSFTRGQLASLSEREEGSLDRELEELVEAGLLLHKSEGPVPRYEFRHALIREAAYESQLKSRRQRYHHRFAALLENPGVGCTAAPPELIAHHYTQAGELEPAIRYWTQAGELALRRSAFEESVSHLEMALRLFQRLPGAARKVEEELRLLVLLGQALITTRSYAVPEVERLYAHITELFQEVKDIPLLIAVCRHLFNQNLMRLNVPLAGKLAKQIVSLGQRVHEPQLLSIGWLLGGINQLIQGNPIEAQQQLGEALAYGGSGLEREPQALGMLEPEPLAMALAYQALTLTIRGEQPKGQQLLEAAFQRSEWLSHLYTHILTSHAACILYQMRFDVHRLLEMTEQVISMYEQNQFPSRESWMPALRGWALVWAGKRDEGYALLLAGLKELSQVGSETGRPYLLCLLADARLRIGLIAEGLAAVSEGLAWGERTQQHMEDAELHRLRGELLLRTEEAAQAPAEFHEAMRLARQSGARCMELRACLSLCHLLRAQGLGREARRLLEELLDSLPPGLDSPELRVARVVLGRLQEAHAEPDVSDGSVFDTPWDVQHS
ncbi:protein kinase domain-containing protein [Archangium lansingense]|uniref:Protein kinase n=1 Tax=Archangium lansingense TaxID=2995310 RepID=A0ABT4AJU0_9BACT|nr:protein kinase [Archangium lansinium]MCY1081958.1 protein kinase [Archangium lansinium]